MVNRNVHPWEPRLGNAPFRFLRFEKLPQSASSTCDDCGHRIQRLFWVRGASGSVFKVGSECVNRVEPLGSVLRAATTKAMKAAVKAAQEERIAAAQALVSLRSPAAYR